MGSFVVLLGVFTASALNFLFQFALARYFSEEDFGVISACFSIIYIALIPIPTFQTAVTKVVTQHYKEPRVLGTIYKNSLKKFLLGGGIVSLVIICIAPFLQSFLKIPSIVPLFAIAIFSGFTIANPVNRGFLQGRLRFGSYTFTFILESVTRILLGILFILVLRLGITGVFLAVVVASGVTFINAIYSNRDLLQQKESLQTQTKSTLGTTSFFYFLALGSLTLCYTADVLLVRHYFNEELAGNYAFASLMAKIIFWLIEPIIAVLFPYSSIMSQQKKQSRRLLKQAFTIATVITFPIIIVFFFAPYTIYTLFPQYVQTAPYIGILGLALLFLSFASMLVNYHLAMNRKNVFVFPLLAFLSEIIGIIWFSSSVYSVALLLLGIATTLVVALFLFSIITKTKEIEVL